MDDRLTSILRRYSHGEISAERAADEMGATYNVADVYVLSREAGLPLPDSKSAWGPGADRHHNILIYFASEGSRFGADPHLAHFFVSAPSSVRLS
jgi:hypothetical protein